jgi:hypothetical protein
MSLVAKINLIPIVKAHLDTLVDASVASNKIFKFDLVTFYAAPLVFGSIIGYFFVPSETLISVLITSLSVFAALLFNLLMLVLGVIEKRKGNKNFILVQRETYANIAYSILVSLVAVGLLIVPYFVTATENDYVILRKVFWGAVFFLLLNFGLTMAMILKRMHAILVKLIDFDS